MANMQLSQLIVGEIHHGIARLAQPVEHHKAVLATRLDLHPDKNMRRFRIGIAVIELGHHAFTDNTAKLLEATRTLGNGHRQDRLALLTQLGALGNVLQTVEVGIGTRVDTQQGLSLSAGLLDILLESGKRQGTRGFRYRPGIVEDILDGGTHLVGIDGDNLIDQIAHDFERYLADLCYRHTLGKHADLIERYTLTGS